MLNPQPDLSGNPFYATKWSEKIGSGRRIKLPKLRLKNSEIQIFKIIELILCFLNKMITFAPRIIIKIYKQCLQL